VLAGSFTSARSRAFQPGRKEQNDAAKMSTVAELPAEFRGNRMCQSVNTAMFRAFINTNLFNRAHLDIRKSVVFYHDLGAFVYPMPELPDAKTLEYLYNQTDVRYYTKGLA
jgi:hypothetical protein